MMYWLSQGALRSVFRRLKEDETIYLQVVAITGQHVRKTRSEFISYVTSKKDEHPELEKIEKKLLGTACPNVI